MFLYLIACLKCMSTYLYFLLTFLTYLPCESKKKEVDPSHGSERSPCFSTLPKLVLCDRKYEHELKKTVKYKSQYLTQILHWFTYLWSS